MPVVDGSLGSLVQGVSQQPDRARRPGQAEEQLNLRNDEVFGLARRPPTTYNAKIASLVAASVWTDAEYGFVKDENGALLFWYAKGTTFKLIDPTTGADVGSFTSSYLPATSKGNVAVSSVDGKILVLNKQKVVAMNTGVSPDYADDLGTVVYARGGASGTEFTIVVTDDTMVVTATVKTSNTVADEITTTYIMDHLLGIFDGTYPNDATHTLTSSTGTETDARNHISANYTLTLIAQHLLIEPDSGSLNARITVEDGSGTGLLVAVTDSIKDVGRLPLRARKNQVVKVLGDVAAEDDYYLRFSTESASATGSFEDREGVWVEDAAPDTNFRIDQTTMPHVLTESGGSYTFDPLDWSDKFAGDDASNPDPKFVGETIQDMIEFQERLVFLHGRQVSMSQAQDILNFFFQTATAQLDDDPINVVPTSGRRSNTMRHAVISNRDLVIYADNDAQFTISGRTKLTPQTASIPLTAEFSMNVGVRPQAAGNVVFYASVVGKHTEISEMFLLGQDEVHDRRSVSQHVPKYITGTADSLVADDGNNLVLCWDSSDEDDTRIYVYEYLWQDRQRVQSAWSTWDFTDRLIAAHIDGATVTLVFHQDDNLPAYIVEIDLARNDATTLDYELHLDRIVTNVGTTVTLPTLPAGRAYVAVQGAGNYLTGLVGTITEAADNGATKDYDLGPGSGLYLIGVAYKTRYVPTMPVIKDRAGVARAKSDLTVARFKIVTADTGPFNMIRETDFEDSADYWIAEWEGFRWDDPDFQLGAVPIDSGVVEFTFEENAATSHMAIETSSHLPLNITEIEWEGSLRGRSTRVNTGG